MRAKAHFRYKDVSLQAQLQTENLRYFIEIAYDGTPYHGWQKQPNAMTVQEKLEEALSTLLREDLTVMGAGRTDTGVHARQLYAHFDSDLDQKSISKDQLCFRLNRFLPDSIAVLGIHEMENEAHARFDAEARSYAYRIALKKNPFEVKRAYLVDGDLDIDAMQSASKILLGKKDFQCFSRSNTDVNTYFCDITEARWHTTGNALVFNITADRFLRNMVRAIVGTLLEIGRAKMDEMNLHNIILSKDRAEAGPSAPAHGLYLTKVSYPQSIFKANGRKQ